MTRAIGSVYNDRYTVEKILHDGAMSKVYIVNDNKLNIPVCLKEVPHEQQGVQNVNYTSLLNEVELLKSLNHPAIPRIIDMQETAEGTSILMDLVMGVPLSHEGIDRSEVSLHNKFIQLAEILVHLHTRPNPIFYRDLKPSNIMLQGEMVRLLDFGISVQITPDNRVITQQLGTKGYAPPEQAKVGAPYDLRSDTYAFGVSFLVLLTGLPPRETLKAVQQGTIRFHSEGLFNIISRCIAKNPEERFASSSDLLQALKNVDEFDSRVLTKRHRRRVAYKFTIAASVASLILGGISLGYGKYQESQTASVALSQAAIDNTPEAYAKAIDLNPTDIEPYFSMLQTIRKDDGVFTSEEEQVLMSTLRSHVSSIKTNERYPELAYQIGELYWFFYDSSSGAPGAPLAEQWFSDALQGGYSPEQSKLFMTLSSFKSNLASAVATSTDSGMYVAYWRGLTTLSTDNVGEVGKLQLDVYTLDVLANYTPRLKSDGVTSEEISAVLKRISDTYKNYSATSEHTEKLLQEIKTLTPQAETAYRAVYEFSQE